MTRRKRSAKEPPKIMVLKQKTRTVLSKTQITENKTAT
jgi:hypothetical protein